MVHGTKEKPQVTGNAHNGKLRKRLKPKFRKLMKGKQRMWECWKQTKPDIFTFGKGIILGSVSNTSQSVPRAG